MTITAKIIADSISPQGIRLTTMQLRYPRFIHAEFMTHRVFSRNASSSRAVPVKKLIEDVRRDPAHPIHWGMNQPGMQSREELKASERVQTERAWVAAMNEAITCAELMVEAGAHKQIVNRLLEPFSHINVVVTATEWANFYALRRHEDAQPEIKALADAMWDAQQTSKPNLLQPGVWHLPYVTEQEWHDTIRSVFAVDDLKKVSVARCARVSYTTHDGKPTTIEEDLALYDRLVGSQPLHASPAEHQATPDQEGYDIAFERKYWCCPERHGNFRGWIQYRKTLPGEFVQG